MGQVRTTMPSNDNKYFIRQAKGGYSTCVQGKPTHSFLDVFNNCVGYACGAYNEQEGLGYEKYHLNCNAENFIERAIASGLSVVQNPVVGGIMVWQKGATLSGSDGAGHVAMCIYNDGKTVKYAQSGYGSSTSFWITTTTNANGRYGLSSSYKYRGCILPKTWKYDGGSTPVQPSTPVTPGAVGKFNIGDKVVINGPLYPSSNAGSPTGNVTNKITEITRRNDGSAHPYNTTGDLGWMDESSISKYNEPTPEVKPEPAPQPTVETFKVGDRVKPTRLVDYNGTHLKQYDDSYTISELKGNRAVLVARGQVWAAMRTEDITHA